MMINSLVIWTETLLYGCTYLSDRVKSRKVKSDNKLLCLSYFIIKFETCWANNNNNNKNNTSIIKNRLALYLNPKDYTLLILKNGQKSS